MKKRRVECKISGRVQGVGFRYFTQDCAQRLHITGWVRNTHGGNVECEAQGDGGQISLFLMQLQEGPPLSYVKKVLCNDIPLRDGESGFEIRY